MSISLQQCESYIVDACTGEISDLLSYADIANQAGHHLYNMRRWKFAEGRTQRLNFRGTITGTIDATDIATKTITHSTAFSGYTRQLGDRIDLTAKSVAGDATELGQYTIASDTATTIVLDESPGNNATGTVTFRMPFDFILLPDDLAEIIGYDATESLVNSLRLTTLQHLLELRTSSVTLSSWNFHGAIMHVSEFAGGPPVPGLSLWPEPGSDDSGPLTIIYRKRWKNLVSDTQNCNIPTHLEPLYIQLLRSFGQSYDNDYDGPSLMDRVDRIRNSDLFASAAAMDDNIQRDFGILRGGAVESGAVWFDWGFHSTIGGPS